MLNYLCVLKLSDCYFMPMVFMPWSAVTSGTCIQIPTLCFPEKTKGFLSNTIGVKETPGNMIVMNFYGLLSKRSKGSPTFQLHHGFQISLVSQENKAHNLNTGRNFTTTMWINFLELFLFIWPPREVVGCDTEYFLGGQSRFNGVKA